MDSIVRPMPSFADYELALMAHIKLWLDTFLSARERFVNITPRTIARPRSWFTQQDFDTLPGYESTPAIIVVSAGTPEPPYMHGTGHYDLTVGFNVCAMTHAPEVHDARVLAGHYQAALTMLLLRQKKVGDQMTLRNWLGMATDDLNNDQTRTLAAIRLNFTYTIKDFVNAYGGPLTVPDNPAAPFPDYEVEHTDIQILNQEEV